MPKINLLPWREELRKERQKLFLVSVGAAIVAALLITAGINVVFSNMIDYQEARNNRLTEEIVKLDEAIKEISGIERQKERLLARMDVIEDLQQSRPEIVHLFDELTRTLPDGVHLNRVTQNGRAVSVSGIAESSTRVSSYMRNVDESEWVGGPELGKIEIARGQNRSAESRTFELDLVQVASNTEDGEDGS
ncbi:MAG: PilN domain-containing protein [Pseudomonadota bacterium]